jgi:transcriptional regulator with XRE-family HTH domain
MPMPAAQVGTVAIRHARGLGVPYTSGTVPRQTLADYLRHARALRRQTQAEFADDAGVSVRTIGNLEAGEVRQYDAQTIARLEAALGWAPGSVQRVLEGGAPVVESDELLAIVRQAWPRLPVEARRLLAELALRALHDGP